MAFLCSWIRRMGRSPSRSDSWSDDVLRLTSTAKGRRYGVITSGSRAKRKQRTGCGDMGIAVRAAAIQVIHSYLSASMGLMRAAFMAG